MYIKDDIDEIKKKLKKSYEQFISDFNFNDYLDRYVYGLKSRMKETLDPMPLEPTETIIEYGGWLRSFEGLLKLTNTKLHNLINVERTGNPRIDYKDRKVLLAWEMLFPEIKMTSDYELQIMKASKKGDLTVKAKDVLAAVEFLCDVDEMKTKLNKIKLDLKKPLDIQLGSGDVTNIIGSAILKAVAKIYKSEITKNLEEALGEAIEESLDSVHLFR